MTAIHLRKPVYDDWERVHEWDQTIDACRYQAWGPNTAHETQAFMSAAIDTWDEDGPARSRYVWVAEAGELGVIGLGELKVLSRAHSQGEISYAVHTNYWRRGFGRQIGAALLHEGFATQQLHRIGGTCDPRNFASAAVLRSLGMTHEGRARHTLLLRDGWRDSELFSILSTEWEATA